MILRVDGVVCWCGAWFLVLFCYLIGDPYSSSANGRNGTWILVRRWYPSFGCLVPGIGRTGWLWKGRQFWWVVNTNQESTSRAMKGTPSFVGGSDQHQPNTWKIFRILKGGVGFKRGTYWHDLPPSPGHWAPGSYGAIGVGWVATASGVAIATVLLGGVSLAGLLGGGWFWQKDRCHLWVGLFCCFS